MCVSGPNAAIIWSSKPFNMLRLVGAVVMVDRASDKKAISDYTCAFNHTSAVQTSQNTKTLSTLKELVMP